MEFPGYSIYDGSPSASEIEKDSLRVVEYLRGAGYLDEHFIIMGRSIGSGPALYLTQKFDFGALVLISPFASLKEIVKDLYGTIPSWLLSSRFDNIQRAKEVRCPCFIVHGM